VQAANVNTSTCAEYYTVQSGDSCMGIETNFGLANDQFLTLNPGVTAQCTNIILGEAYSSGSLTNCTTYYTIISGQSCMTIITQFFFTLSHFFHWNPEVNTGCTNIFLGSAYCIVGGGNPCQKMYTVVSGDLCSTIETKERCHCCKFKCPQSLVGCQL
ncbi:hypothetical protein L208DRAFT_1292425, partial [Tricholoma matsutake]